MKLAAVPESLGCALLATLAGLAVKAMQYMLDKSQHMLGYTRTLQALSVAFEGCNMHKYNRRPDMAQ